MMLSLLLPFELHPLQQENWSNITALLMAEETASRGEEPHAKAAKVAKETKEQRFSLGPGCHFVRHFVELNNGEVRGQSDRQSEEPAKARIAQNC